MEKYVNYLLEDIKKVIDNPPEKPYIEIPEDYEEIRDMIEWEHSPRRPMKQWFGIEKEAFPAEDKLSDEQINTLTNALNELWERFHYYPVLPQNLPERYRYTFLVKGLDEEVAYVSGGRTWIEFCDNDTEGCPFPEGYCLCDEEEG
ncbi:MAG: hypothetical protein ACOC0C_03095 [Bacteroidota bacterium]